MQAAHLLLGRPWKFDRAVTHDGGTNCYKFRCHGKKVVLKPLLSEDVQADQRQLEASRRRTKGESSVKKLESPLLAAFHVEWI
ncbi:unnamed protein product [Linum trigynum]|uniref:Uncharacterized protein n=1 Tax=Linum trigynum TaxID=586398 RepID=A0AAV2CEL5_9ROSI